MKQYTDLLRKILEQGRLKPNRTGVDVLSLIGPQMEFDMDDGFPLVTERPIFVDGIIHENLWFIDGRCNNEALIAEGVKIWNQWALKEDHTREASRTLPDVVNDYVAHRQTQMEEGIGFTYEDAVRELSHADKEDAEKGLPILGKELDAKSHLEIMGGHRLLREAGISLTQEEVLMPKGYLGPIYGVLWRGWIDHMGNRIDQLSNIFNKLASDNPKLRYSRANIITAYNPSVLPDETVGAEENIKAGRQALAACHTMFQFFAEPMTLEERLAWAKKNDPEKARWFPISESIQRDADGKILEDELADITEVLDSCGIAKDQLSCKLYQRSADFPVGVPFNIAGYALLLHMFAAQLNMKPAKFVHTFGDAHIYVDQIEGVKELLTREATALPTLWLNPEVDSLLAYKREDFRIDGYSPVKPQIEFAVAV